MTGPHRASQHEAQRQQLLLAALRRGMQRGPATEVATEVATEPTTEPTSEATSGASTNVTTNPATQALLPWLQDPASSARGLAAYCANANELAQRALAAAYPVVQQLLGDESFAALARSLWHQHPPQAGDIALWGDTLAAFLEAAMATTGALASEAYLPDIARLEWAVHAASRAADAATPQGLALLADADPARLRLLLAPGTALIASKHPVRSIWQAHQHRAHGTSPNDANDVNDVNDADDADDAKAADPFADARIALAAGVGETALVCRRGWRVHVLPMSPMQTRFTQGLLAGGTLAQALDAGTDVEGAAFAFEAWLIHALQTQLLVGVLKAD
jgi:Putative DNA-binding domain